MGDAEVVAKHLAAVLRQKYADLHIIAHPGDINRWYPEAAVFSIIYKTSKTCKKRINGSLHLYMTSDIPQYFSAEEVSLLARGIKGNLLLHDHLVELGIFGDLPAGGFKPLKLDASLLIARSDQLTNDSDFVCVDLVSPDSVTTIEDWTISKLDTAYNATI